MLQELQGPGILMSYRSKSRILSTSMELERSSARTTTASCVQASFLQRENEKKKDLKILRNKTTVHGSSLSLLTEERRPLPLYRKAPSSYIYLKKAGGCSSSAARRRRGAPERPPRPDRRSWHGMPIARAGSADLHHIPRSSFSSFCIILADRRDPFKLVYRRWLSQLRLSYERTRSGRPSHRPSHSAVGISDVGPHEARVPRPAPLLDLNPIQDGLHHLQHARRGRDPREGTQFLPGTVIHLYIYPCIYIYLPLTLGSDRKSSPPPSPPRPSSSATTRTCTRTTRP